MPDYDSPQDAALEDMQIAKLTAATIDVFVRNLEMAKAQLEAAQDDSAFPNTICTLVYGHTGTFCPLLYLHFPVETKSADD